MSPRFELGDPMQHVVVDKNGCWVWQRAKLANGYGRLSDQYAHRLYYEHFTGETIPKGMHTDHLCRNRACCNPEHLEIVTPAENIRRGWEARESEERINHGTPRRIRVLLAERDRKLTWLSQQSGIPYGSLYSKMRGVAIFTEDDALAIAAVFGLEPADLLEAEEAVA